MNSTMEKLSQVNLQIMPDRHLSLGDVMQMIPIEWDNSKVKREDSEESQDDNTSPASEDVTAACSFIKVEIETDYEMPDEAAVKQAELYHNALGLHTEYDIPLDIVKKESFGDADAREDSGSEDDTETNDIIKTEADDVLPSAPVSKIPRLTTQMNYEETPENNLTRSDQTKDNNEEPKSGAKTTVEEKPVKKYKSVKKHDKIDIRLRKHKQNDSISDPNNAHKEMFGIKIFAGQSVISRSCNKLKPLLCDTCQKCFRFKSNLITHIRSHSDATPYKCNVCKKCFKHKGSLDRHTLIHTGEKPYNCNVCKKNFNQKGSLDKHTRTHTGEKPYKCNLCKKCFKYKIYLDSHMRAHTGEKHPYQCNFCKKYFSMKNNLNRHTRTHTGEKPYECNICKKGFSDKSKLNKHTRTHTGEMPYQCNICMKGFTDKSSLDKHTRAHSGEKPYKCTDCKKCFNQKVHLDRHSRTHTGEKPYQCHICKKFFSEKGNLDKHTRKHIGEMPY